MNEIKYCSLCGSEMSYTGICYRCWDEYSKSYIDKTKNKKKENCKTNQGDNNGRTEFRT